MSKSPRLCLASLSLFIALVAAPASAQNVAAADTLFNKGVEDMDAGRYKPGCAAIAESYRLDPAPGALFTLAECHAKAGNIATAVARYAEYLRVFEDLSPAQQAKQSAKGRDKTAAAQKAALGPKLPELTLTLPTSAPPGTKVVQDNVELGDASLGIGLPIDPGEHVVKTQAPGGPVTENRIRIAAGEKKRIELKVQLKAPAAGARPSNKPDRVASAPPSSTMVEPSAMARLNWISLSIVQDTSLFSGEGVCLKEVQDRDHFICLRQDQQQSRYLGTPTSGIANNINYGFSFSSLRATLGYDRVLLDNLSIGLRVGAAIAGPSHESVSFFRLHLEARAAYWIGTKPLEHTGARPYLFASGGLAQFNSKSDVNILEDGSVCGAANPADELSPCTKTSSDGVKEPRTQTLSTYKQAGVGFISIGGGLAYAPIPIVMVNLGLRVSVTLLSVTTVISPETSVSVGF